MRQTRCFKPKPKRPRKAVMQDDQPEVPWLTLRGRTSHVQAVLEAADDFLRRTAA
jgi:hypothetical protein